MKLPNVNRDILGGFQAEFHPKWKMEEEKNHVIILHRENRIAGLINSNFKRCISLFTKKIALQGLNNYFTSTKKHQAHTPSKDETHYLPKTNKLENFKDSIIP